MTWARPEYLPLLGLVVLVALVVGFGWRSRSRAMAQLGSATGLVAPRATVARGWQAVLALGIPALLVVAAAGPRVGFDWEQRRMEGVSLVVALDVSRSMDAQDVSPSRIERARRELLDLAALLGGDSVGLVLFAEGAWVRIPLTVDYDTFRWAVKDSATDTIRAQGTALSGAIDAGVGMLSRAPGTGKALLVVSDGEVHEEAAAVDAAVERARAAGVRIYALGVGDAAGAPIPLPEGGFKKDEKGEVVLSRLDEDRLRSLAAATSGAYVRAVPSDDDVRALYLDEIRGKLEAAERGVKREQVWRERFMWPAALGLGLMAVSAALGVGRLRRVAAAAPLLLLLLLPTPARAGTVEDAWADYAAGRWAEAAEGLAQARLEDPGDPALTRALGTALYRAGRFRDAEVVFAQAAASADEGPERAKDLFNAGHAAYRTGDLATAARYFDEASRADPAFAAAKGNAEAVAREIEARRNPPPEPPPQQEPEQPSPQDGEPQDQPQAGEGREPPPPPPDEGQEPPPEGQAQPGQGEAVPQDGQPQDGEPQPGEGEPGSGEPLAGEGEEGVEVEESAAGDLTAEQAGRIVDAVPEGRPRTVRGGRSGREDW